MKVVARFLLWLVIGLITTAALFIFSIWLFLVIGGDIQYPYSTEFKFLTHRKDFETVCQYMSDFDLSPYANAETTDTHVLIQRSDAEDAEKPYTVSVYTGEYEPVEVEDAAAAEALDTLFGKVGMSYVVQDASDSELYVYFGIEYATGVVYSPDGEEPTITPERVPYYFHRIDDHWFYWHDDD